MSRADDGRGGRPDDRRGDRTGSSTTTTPGSTSSSRRTTSSRSPSRAASAPTSTSTWRCSSASSARASPAGSPSTASRSSSTTRTATRAARRSPGPTTSTSRCSSCRCATTASTIGVITLSKLGLDGFGSDDLRLLTILADRAATAIGSARLLTRTQDLARELRRLLDMSAELSGSLDPRQVAELMAGHLAPRDGRRRVRHQLLGPGRRAGRVARLLPGRTGSQEHRAVLRGRRLPRDAARPRAPGRRSSSMSTTRPPTRPRSSSCVRDGNRGPGDAAARRQGPVDRPRRARSPTAPVDVRRRAPRRSPGRWPTRRPWRSRTPGSTRRPATSPTATR